MDIYCPKCGEPWEMDSLHDLVDDGDAENYHKAVSLFRNKGCEAFGCSHEMHPGKEMTALASVLMFEMLGDDVDGVASMMEDFEIGY